MNGKKKIKNLNSWRIQFELLSSLFPTVSLKLLLPPRYTYTSRPSNKVKAEDERHQCLATDKLGPGWAFSKKTRSNGVSYREFFSPEGVKFRSLKKAREHYSLCITTADADDDNDDDDVDGNVFDDECDDDDSGLDADDLDINEDVNGREELLNDSDDNGGETDDNDLMNELASLKSPSDDEDDTTNDIDLIQVKGKSDATSGSKTEGQDESLSHTNKKIKVDKSDDDGVVNVDASSSSDRDNFTTPKRNLFRDDSSDLGDSGSKIEMLEKQLAELKEAERKKQKSNIVSKGKSEVTHQTVVRGSASREISPSVSQTPNSVVTNFDNAKIPVYKSPSGKNQGAINGPILTCEVSATFTDISGEYNFNLVFISGGADLWIMKGAVLSQTALSMLSNAVSGKIADVFVNWVEVFYRAVPSGQNTHHRRAPKLGDTRLPYPSSRLMSTMKNPVCGFSVENCIKHLESQWKAMSTRSDIPAHLLNEHLKAEIPILHTKFMEGSYRRDGQKNTPYKNETELKKFFEEAFQRQFKYGFSRVVYDIPLDKFLLDSEIKKFLLSLGYNSFDEVNDHQKQKIYLSGNFPQWDSIVEEPIN